MKSLAAALLLLTLTPAQERGRHIYFHGQSPSGRPITASVAGGTAFSAAIVPCVNCHGEDGRGRIEASVRPADLTPEMLARSLTINTRARPPYTRSHLKRAIGMGIDSGRTPLSPAMPRYAMTNDDASDLLDFLALLGKLAQPGVSEEVIRIGIAGDDALVAGDLRIYGRRLELMRDGDDKVFVRIDFTAEAHPSPIPTIALASLLSSDAEQRIALRDYARKMGADPTLATDCSARENTMLLMTARIASQCDIASLPNDREVIVAVERPPHATILGLVASLLATLGRDVTRDSFMAEWEKRLSTQRGWLMRFDPATQRLTAVP